MSPSLGSWAWAKLPWHNPHCWAQSLQDQHYTGGCGISGHTMGPKATDGPSQVALTLCPQQTSQPHDECSA